MMSASGLFEDFAQTRLVLAEQADQKPAALFGWLLFGSDLMHMESCCLLTELSVRLAQETVSIWPMYWNPWAGTMKKLWPNRVKLLNFSIFTSLLHFKEQPQLEQLGLNCRGECFRELCWLSQMSLWNPAPVSSAQTQHLIVP